MKIIRQVKISVPSHLDSLTLSGPLVHRAVELMGGTKEEARTIELCTMEVVNNCFIHAYRRRSGKEIDIDVIGQKNYFEIVIRNQGIALNPAQLRRSFKKNPDKHVEGEGMHGLGLFLVKNLMSRVRCFRRNKINYFVMKKSRQNSPFS